MTNKDAGLKGWMKAKHMARYGHKDWIAWVDKRGVPQAEPCTAENLKRCLLESGTQGHWTLYSGISSMRGSWWIGTNTLRQMKRGLRNGQ